MRKIYTKLTVAAIALILSISVVAMSSYAWFVLSDSPTVSNIQVAIGGGNTILIAPDMTVEADGTTYHYPGPFSDTLNFSQYDSYAYLQDLGGLTPVSTADGTNWFLPEYYDTTDPLVQQGKVPSGQLKPISQFRVDDWLEYANLRATEKEKIAQGSYIYLDFWVVSPGANYTLHLSTGDDSNGSFLIDLMEPVVSENGESGYSLSTTGRLSPSTCARVGFLASPDRVTDRSMEYYQNSYGFDQRYTQLRGLYQDKGSTPVYGSYRFMVYEPNGDSHPNDPAMDGSYAVTSPIAYVNGVPAPVDISTRLTVQKTNFWALAENKLDTALEQRFQAAILGMDVSGMDSREISDVFYGKYLQGQISPYVDKADFIKRTSDIYKFDSIVTQEQLAALDTAGATEDVYIIELERNVPQRIRMFVWLEGQDMDCVDGLLASRFALNIELAGSTKE